MKVKKLLNAILKHGASTVGEALPVSLTVTNGTFTVTSCTAVLIGNTMRLAIGATAKSAISAGNITNQTMMTITINDERITQAYTVDGVLGSSGPLASLHYRVGSIPNVITVTLCALAQNIASGGVVNSYVAIPVARKWVGY